MDSEKGVEKWKYRAWKYRAEVSERRARILEEELNLVLGLPSHLTLTYAAIRKLEFPDANEIAKETRKARAVESNYANQLTHLGAVKREKKGRVVHFYTKYYEPK